MLAAHRVNSTHVSVVWRAALIVAAGAFVYWPALNGAFLWDDLLDVVDNRLLRDAAGLWKIWTQPQLLYDFYPLKHTVQWLQWQLWGSHPTGYHVTNLALHLSGALLFWRVLGQLGLRHGWLGGLVFAVHPLAVESVAWIAELKNTLSLPPLLLSLSAFITYAEQGRRGDAWRSASWFLVSMLCKSAAVTFPVFLLLYVWWRHRAISRRDFAAVAPFFVVSVVLGAAAVWFQQHRAIADSVVEIGGWRERLMLPGTAGAFYLGKCLWPAPLMAVYPKWPLSPVAWWHVLPWVGLVAGTMALWRRRDTWGRHGLLGLGWFVLLLAPCAGVVTISFMHYSWVMDHLAYLPLLGIVALAVAAMDLVGSPAARTGLVFAVCGTSAWLAREHAAVFRDEHSLWTHNVRENPNAWVAHFNLGVQQAARGDVTAARVSYEATLRLKPDYAPAHNNLGKIFHDSGQIAEARRAFATALRLQPNLPDAHVNTGNLLRETGDLTGAMHHLDLAIRLAPQDPATWNNLALVHQSAGRPDEAERAFATALRVQPDYFEGLSNYGAFLRRAGRLDEAEARYRAALRLRPDSPTVWFNLGNLQRARRQFHESIVSYEQSLRARSNHSATHLNLAFSLRDTGRLDEARQHYAEARRLDPALPPAPF